ncbi:MAG: aspartyl protease family protein [Armatimonas sp.]
MGKEPLRLILDTGAGVNVLTPEAAARLGLKLTDAPFAVSGATVTKAKVCQVPKLSLGSINLAGSFVVLPLPAALNCDGILGGPFFEKFMVTIDSFRNKLSLAPPKSKKLTGPVLPLRLVGGIPQVYGSVEGISGWFRMDTGADDVLTLFPGFVERHKLRDKFPKRIETVVGRGVGGLLTGELVKVSRLTLGPHTLGDFVADLSTQTEGTFADRDSAGNLGNALLRRFILTLDYQGKKVQLLRAPGFGEPFPTNRAGLGVDYESGKASVLAVLPDSPAADAKLQPGDVVLTIDGEAVTPTRMRAALRQRAGITVRLTVQRGTEPPSEVALVLRDLL